MRIDNNLELTYTEEYFYKENNSYFCLIYNKDNIFKSISFCVDGLTIGYDDF